MFIGWRVVAAMNCSWGANSHITGSAAAWRQAGEDPRGWFARRAQDGRPVMWEFTREEQFIAATTRHPMNTHVKLGAKWTAR